MTTNALALFILLASIVSCTEPSDHTPAPETSSETMEPPTQNTCNWCGTSEHPEDVTWSTKIAPDDEPGERIIISGTVYQSDGTTPAEGVIIYAYHTNIEGIYPKRGNEEGNGKYHGYLRGWMKTDAHGKYEFETIRPAPYHSHGGEPAHIHYTIQSEEYPEYWLASVWFKDDPRVTDELVKNVQRNGGFSNVVSLNEDENGIFRGERNIVLESYE